MRERLGGKARGFARLSDSFADRATIRRNDEMRLAAGPAFLVGALEHAGEGILVDAEHAAQLVGERGRWDRLAGLPPLHLSG